MTGRRYGPLAYVPITRRPQLTWPDSARVALWVNPKIEFFGLDDVMPGNQNERVPRDRAKIPNVRNWAAPAATSSPGCEPKCQNNSWTGIPAAASPSAFECVAEARLDHSHRQRRPTDTYPFDKKTASSIMQILSQMRRRFAEWPKVDDAMIKAVIAMARDIATAVDNAGLLPQAEEALAQVEE